MEEAKAKKNEVGDELNPNMLLAHAIMLTMEVRQRYL